MKIPIDIDAIDLSFVDTPPPPQLEVDLSALEISLKNTPVIIHPVIVQMFSMMAPKAEFGYN